MWIDDQSWRLDHLNLRFIFRLSTVISAIATSPAKTVWNGTFSPSMNILKAITSVKFAPKSSWGKKTASSTEKRMILPMPWFLTTNSLPSPPTRYYEGERHHADVGAMNRILNVANTLDLLFLFHLNSLSWEGVVNIIFDSKDFGKRLIEKYIKRQIFSYYKMWTPSIWNKKSQLVLDL